MIFDDASEQNLILILTWLTFHHIFVKLTTHGSGNLNHNSSFQINLLDLIYFYIRHILARINLVGKYEQAEISICTDDTPEIHMTASWRKMGTLPINYFFMNFTFKAICPFLITGKFLWTQSFIKRYSKKNKELGQKN